MDTLLLPPPLPQSKRNTKCLISFIWKVSCSLFSYESMSMTAHYFYSVLVGLPDCVIVSIQIAEEPPPLREIPPDCSPHTADVIKRGLQREPSRRASAKDLRVQTAKALKQRTFPITPSNCMCTATDYMHVGVFYICLISHHNQEEYMIHYFIWTAHPLCQIPM